MIKWKVNWITQFGEHRESLETNTDTISEMVRYLALTSREINIKMVRAP